MNQTNQNKWKPLDDVNIYFLKKGSLIRGTTMTHGQKWLMKSGYEDCNCTIYGLTITDEYKDMYDVMVDKLYVSYVVDPYSEMLDKVCYAVRDIGTSGISYLEYFDGTEEEIDQMINELRNRQELY